MIEVAIRHGYGDFSLDVAFTAGEGVTVLFGPSGAGKTTVVRALAGILRPRWGRIVLDGETLIDTDRGIFVPKHRRRIGCVFQDALLFPHLSVRGNLAFGRWFANAAARRAFPVSQDEIVELLGIGPLMHRMPARLSGGERQRVALGRALLAAPRLLVMDEPLASLDQQRKDEVLPYLVRLQAASGVPVVYVTHSREEIAQLGGQVVEIGRMPAGESR